MTDPVKAANFEKYGNLEGGYGSFHVSIALPRKIQEKEQQILVLVVLFIVCVLLIPGYFYYTLSADRTDIGGILKDNRAIFM